MKIQDSQVPDCSFVYFVCSLTAQKHYISHIEPVSLPNHTFFGAAVQCTFFRQKLKTAFLESKEGREWPSKRVHDKSPQKNVSDSADIESVIS